ncbi:MAG: serine hydrolase [Patescibacteria group bacterium]|nr:serine hydrolase [Patescibacteria group bacterium]
MSKNIKNFALGLIFCFIFFGFLNLFDEKIRQGFFCDKNSIKTASIQGKIIRENQKEFVERKKENLNIEARGAISVFENKNGTKKILFQKNEENKFPIASITKLMTAYVVLNNYCLEDSVKISNNAIDKEGRNKHLKQGQILSVKDLLYPLLVESNNGAAYALADSNGLREKEFVNLMNYTAQKTGLNNTYFFNSTGLDLDKNKGNKVPVNYSTCNDLAKFISHLLNQKSKNNEIIWDIASMPSVNFADFKLINTNKFLGGQLNWQKEIIGGKTGFTYRAKECFILVVETPDHKGFFINIILGAKDRFKEMEKLVDYDLLVYKKQ